jgi:hypothetical protein
MFTASAGCFGPVPFPSSNNDCPDGPAPLVPIQVIVSNWTAGVLTFTVRAICDGSAMAPDNLTYKVLSANLTMFLNGTTGTGPEVLGARVTFAFDDANSTGLVDRGDIFSLSIDPPERAPLLGGGRVDAFNNSMHNIVGLAHIPFPAPPHVGLSLSSHSGNNTTITVNSVENLPPTTFDELQFTIYNRRNTHYQYLGPDPHIAYMDSDADGAFSAGDQLIVSVDPAAPDEQTGGRIEVSFFGLTVGTLAPLP